MFRRFGSQVTVVQRGGQLLPREDRDIADEVVRILREDRIEVLLDARADSVEPAEGGGVRLHVSTPTGERVLAGSHLLVAVGRVPNTDDLNLAAAGIETDKQGYIPVNDRLETAAPGIYALGDVKGGPAFTHISYDDYRILKANVLEGGNASIAGPDGAVRGVHGPAAGTHRPERASCPPTGPAHPGGEDADEPASPARWRRMRRAA